MVKSGGSIHTAASKLQIYAIVRGYYIYIGVTEKLIVNRWHSHFSENGSFVSALTRVNEDETSRDKDVYFFLYDLSSIEILCRPESRRRVLEYIEHEIHLCIGRNQFFTPKFRLISDTVRTAPTNCAISAQYIENATSFILHDLEEKISLVM
jgi:hypothetical protein